MRVRSRRSWAVGAPERSRLPATGRPGPARSRTSATSSVTRSSRRSGRRRRSPRRQRAKAWAQRGGDPIDRSRTPPDRDGTSPGSAARRHRVSTVHLASPLRPAMRRARHRRRDQRVTRRCSSRSSRSPRRRGVARRSATAGIGSDGRDRTGRQVARQRLPHPLVGKSGRRRGAGRRRPSIRWPTAAATASSTALPNSLRAAEVTPAAARLDRHDPAVRVEPDRHRRSIVGAVARGRARRRSVSCDRTTAAAASRHRPTASARSTPPSPRAM